MSGPKSSRYTLTPEQRAALEEQRRQERRRAVARETVKLAARAMHTMGSTLPEGATIAAALKKDRGFADKRKQLETCIAAANAAVAATGTEDTEALETIAGEVTRTLAKAQALAAELSRITAANRAELEGNIAADLDRGFSTSFAELSADPAAQLAEKKQQLRQRLQAVLSDPALSGELHAQVEAALQQLETIDSEHFLKNFESLSVAPLCKRCKAQLEEAAACRAEFDRLLADYLALCELYYYVPQQYACCRASLEQLRQEIARITEAVAQDDEQAYISDCLDEVMAEMGYTVLGSREVTKKNGKRFRSELYTYGEGTAVNVTYSADGKIAMELGGLDTADRLPTTHETAALVDSMERFCSDFPEIERRLAAKGVVLAQRLSMLPVSPEYAQIINTSDYEMTAKAQKLQQKKQRTTRRKAMRKEQ